VDNWPAAIRPVNNMQLLADDTEIGLERVFCQQLERICPDG
jgi:hypothetical protein